MNVPARTHFRAGSRKQIVGNLAALGVPASMIARQKPSLSFYPKHANKLRYVKTGGSFWQRPVNFIEVLEVARHRWMRLCRRWHPDVKGGCAETMKALNGLWATIERRFREHGYTLG